MKYKEFETERLLIRPTSTQDSEFILELLNTPQWIQFVGERNVKTVQDATNYINTKMLPQLKKLGYSNNTVIRKSDNRKIGSCGLYKRDGLENVDIGFAFLPDYYNQGYAYECTYELMKIAFSEYNIQTLNAITVKENIASQKLLKKLDFKYIKVVKIPKDEVELLLFEKHN